jgi:small subunit ribosomal protein S6
MKNYEITFIVDPVLSRDEIEATARTYVDLLKKDGCEIVHVDKIGLRQLAYPINKRTSGEYYCIEFETPTGELIAETELSLRRDERIIRFLTVKLDKYGVKYNEDKRKGLIGKSKKEEEDKGKSKSKGKSEPKPKPKPKAKAEVKAKEEAKAEAKAKEEAKAEAKAKEEAKAEAKVEAKAKAEAKEEE